VNDVLQTFLDEEVTEAVYNELWNFISSDSVVCGTFECSNHAVMKISSAQFIIYRICIGMENTKCQPAVLVARTYLLKKINSKAYERRLPDIQNIFD